MFMKSPCNYQEKIRHNVSTVSSPLTGTNKEYSEENYERQYTFKKEHCSLKPAEKTSSCNQKLNVAYPYCYKVFFIPKRKIVK
jgi:hypothetical protein